MFYLGVDVQLVVGEFASELIVVDDSLAWRGLRCSSDRFALSKLSWSHSRRALR